VGAQHEADRCVSTALLTAQIRRLKSELSLRGVGATRGGQVRKYGADAARKKRVVPERGWGQHKAERCVRAERFSGAERRLKSELCP
jgi:hypothetical protein